MGTLEQLSAQLMKHTRSEKLFARSCLKIPGGVNSPVRAFKSVGGHPIFIKKAKGAYLTDVDGNSYVDYVGSWGPMILGHGYPAVLKALRKNMEKGLSYGAPTELELEMADTVSKAFPSMEKVRFVSSGTEAVMGAIRVARGFTRRNKVIKFDGCYHGHADYLLVKAGSGMATLGTPDSAGVPPSFAAETLVARLNDLNSVEALFKKFRNQIAVVIIEPVVGNMGVILPHPGFLKKLQKLCRQYGALLMLDEVMTGFRLSYGGAQEVYGIKPDLTSLGKIIGGGLPVGAYGGRREIMDCVAPVGAVYQAGTLSGNPMAMTAGLETLKALRQLKPYARLDKITQKIAYGIQEEAEKLKIPMQVAQQGSMFTTFFAEDAVANADQARKANTERFKKYFQGMLAQGIYLAPSQFEACFVSIAHGEKEVSKTLKAARSALKKL